MVTVTVTTRRVMTDSEKYCFDHRLGLRGEQAGSKTRRYSLRGGAGDAGIREAIADIQKTFRAKVTAI